MNIVLLSPAMFIQEGGIERLMRLYMKALCEICDTDGHIYSLTLNDTSRPPDTLRLYSNDRLINHKGFDRNKLNFAIQTLRLARNSDIIFCGHIHQLIIAKLAQVFNAKLRYYLVAHGIDVWRAYTALERWALRGAEQVICSTEYTRKQMLYFYNTLDPARIKIIPNPLDPYLSNSQRCSDKSKSNITRSPPSITPTRSSKPTILSVGRLKLNDPGKGFDKLLEAMPQVLRVYPEAQLHIVGTGDALPTLQSLAKNLGVNQSVTFTGRLSDSDLVLEYSSCTLFALPSSKEGFGLVYLEAMTYGKPCICANSGGAPEVVSVPDTGLAVEYGNISELAAAIIELLRHPRKPEVVRKHMEQFSYKRFRDRLAELLPQ